MARMNSSVVDLSNQIAARIITKNQFQITWVCQPAYAILHGLVTALSILSQRLDNGIVEEAFFSIREHNKLLIGELVRPCNKGSPDL